LRGCTSLVTLPDEIGALEGLEMLMLHDCSSLVSLPHFISGLTGLREFYLNGCVSLAALPETIGMLDALEELYLHGCTKLQELPRSIGQLGALQTLSLFGCSNLRALPKTIGGLEALKTLNLSECRSLVTLPKTMGHLGALKTLCLGGCTSLRPIPNLIQQFRLKDIFLDESGASRGVQEKYRRLSRRICDSCGRQGTLEEQRFPVCYCGDRRYCDEACQQADWDRGHSATCASGYSFNAEEIEGLDYLRKIHSEGDLGDEAYERARNFYFVRNPPPDDRER